MASLLERLEAIQIDRRDAVDALDQAFMDRQEALYREAVEVLTDVKRRMEAIFASYDGDEDRNKDGYISRHHDIYRVEQRLKEIREQFIGRIVGHFADRYKVRLSTDQVIRELDGQEATAKAILECIHHQLGGRTFQELAIHQVKAALAERTQYRKPEIKGCRVSFPRFVYPDFSLPDHPHISWRDQEDLHVLLRALQLFGNGRLELSWPFTAPLEAVSDTWRHDPFQRFDLGSGKVRTFRLYKNGKVEVGFASNELASQFVAEYTRKAD